MQTEYLTWIKDLYKDIHDKSDVRSLLSSNVYEPSVLFKKHIKANRDRLENLVSTFNEWGHTGLLEAIAKKNQIDIKNIVLANGASNAIAIVCQALLHKDDQVVIEQPVYQPFESVTESIGAEIVRLRRNKDDFGIDIGRLEFLVNEKTKLIILTNLHNPSGHKLRRDDLLQIAATAKKVNPNIFIMVDEIYADFAAGDFDSAFGLDDCFIVISSLTKVYGLGMLRCGWILASDKIADKIRRQWMISQGCGSRILESLSLLAFDHLDLYLARSKKIISANRKAVRKALSPFIKQGLLIGKIPERGCIYFPKLRDTEDSTQFTDFLRDQYKLYVAPGSFFGAPDHFRIGYGGDPPKTAQALDILKDGLTAYK